MLLLSLLINVLVLAPIIVGLRSHRAAMERVFGPDGTARQILTCIYAAIFAMSLALLALSGPRATWAPPLLLVQVIYKLLSGAWIRDRRTPVLWFNLAIAAFHAATLITLA